ncbi:hypothetical protein [Alteribacter natronophilus]|uniref:hypothetical protein n=1 Tax=Alteribacter natronophilus TaxID=2583810 RepID=UPI00110DCC11|nr:hypothetical protein [Alteribacter natronophilus]TMW71541.1 hypothetical protein FGB90_10905 [Alteribacter natronophilus]
MRESAVYHWKSTGAAGVTEVFAGSEFCLEREGTAADINGQQSPLLLPFAGLPLIAAGGAEQFLLTDREIAVCCGLPLRPEVKEQALKSVLFRFGIDLEDFCRWVSRDCRTVSEPKDLSAEQTTLASRAGLAVFLQRDWEGSAGPGHPVSKMLETSREFWMGKGAPGSLLRTASMYQSLSDPDSCASLPWKRALKRLAEVMERYCPAGLPDGWYVYYGPGGECAAVWHPDRKLGGAICSVHNAGSIKQLCRERIQAFEQAVQA